MGLQNRKKLQIYSREPSEKKAPDKYNTWQT